MTLSTGRTKLKQSHQNLEAAWEAVCEGWDDAARREFGEKHVMPIEPEVTAALRAIDRLSVVMAQMRADCS